MSLSLPSLRSSNRLKQKPVQNLEQEHNSNLTNLFKAKSAVSKGIRKELKLDLIRPIKDDLKTSWINYSNSFKLLQSSYIRNSMPDKARQIENDHQSMLVECRTARDALHAYESQLFELATACSIRSKMPSEVQELELKIKTSQSTSQLAAELDEIEQKEKCLDIEKEKSELEKRKKKLLREKELVELQCELENSDSASIVDGARALSILNITPEETINAWMKKSEPYANADNYLRRDQMEPAAAISSQSAVTLSGDVRSSVPFSQPPDISNITTRDTHQRDGLTTTVQSAARIFDSTIAGQSAIASSAQVNFSVPLTETLDTRDTHINHVSTAIPNEARFIDSTFAAQSVERPVFSRSSRVDYSTPASGNYNSAPTNPARTQFAPNYGFGNYSPLHQDYSSYQQPVNDVASRELLISSLKKKPSKPFGGEPEHYHRWISTLKHRLDQLRLDPLDVIDILESHTEGIAQDVVMNAGTIVGRTPNRALENIFSELETRFGADSEVAASLQRRLKDFPPIIGNEGDLLIAKKLRDLGDLCQMVCRHMSSTPDLLVMNYPLGLEIVRDKLPKFMDNKWVKFKENYRVKYGVMHPPFDEFTKMIKDVAKMLCQDQQSRAATSQLLNASDTRKNTNKNVIKSRAGPTEAKVLHTSGNSSSTSTSASASASASAKKCQLHGSTTHNLHECSTFIDMNSRLKHTLARSYNLCTRCLLQHSNSPCASSLSCTKCGANNHITAMHIENRTNNGQRQQFNASYSHPRTRNNNSYRSNNNFRASNSYPRPSVPSSQSSVPSSQPSVSPPQPSNSSTENNNSQNTPKSRIYKTASSSISGNNFGKTLLVDISNRDNGKRFRTYAILDDQSTVTLGTPKFFEELGIASQPQQYLTSTVNGHGVECSGRIGTGLSIQGVGEEQEFSLPPVYENELIINTLDEVATREMVEQHPVLYPFAHHFHPIDNNAEVTLLIGRNAEDLHYARTDQLKAPFAVQTHLGWSVIGSLNSNSDRDSEANNTIMCCRPSNTQSVISTATVSPSPIETDKNKTSGIEQDVFKKYRDDEEEGLSVQDKVFKNIIRNNIHINHDGFVETPLPVKYNDLKMPCNREAVYRRELSTVNKWKNDPVKINECIAFMKPVIDAGHVEKVPQHELNTTHSRLWYLPVFSVTHKRKGKIRLVFDSAAQFAGVSLNSVLLTGPNENNKLRSVLTHFREGTIGFISDIHSMFHSFYVDPVDRDLMRFYWFDSNDPNNPLVQYRAKTHIFGNCSSPAVATSGLRYAAETAAAQLAIHSTENTTRAVNYIKDSFYVDDGLDSCDTVDEAINILKSSQKLLSQFKIKLHKIICNNPDVIAALPAADCSVSLDEFHFENDHSQHALGMSWSIKEDRFIVKSGVNVKPFTKRGLLSTVNSIYDPLGIASPVVLHGRLLQRRILAPTGDDKETLQRYDWDDILPGHYSQLWQSWTKSLEQLSQLSIPRSFKPLCFGNVSNQVLHVFSDASEDGIGHVAYLRSVNQSNEIHVAFVCGDSKVAPRSACSIPRLELCAALDATQAAQRICNDMHRKPDAIKYYTDSKVVIGYLQNETKRFSKYVERRVDLILKNSNPSQWHYISTKINPADLASRPSEPKTLSSSSWLSGPKFLWQPTLLLEENPALPMELPEVCSANIALITVPSHSSLFTRAYEKNSSWEFLLKISGLVLSFCCVFMQKIKSPKSSMITNSLEDATELIIRDAQKSHLGILINSIKNNNSVGSKFDQLSPFIDSAGIIRVGGRLHHSDLLPGTKHPIIIPYKHPICNSLIEYYHVKCKHQGRHVTLGTIRTAGYYLERGSYAIKKFLGNCVLCKRLRSPLATQKMADLPYDRVQATAPFSNVGLDVFGHWMIKEGSTTRRNAALKKTWALIITCLSSRAVHIEVLPSMDTVSFINALRRFLSIRGPCKIIRSDRGSNFLGATNQSVHLDLQSVEKKLHDSSCKWIYNPPHASHFGGAWERKIGQIRRVLDATLLMTSNRTLNRDELHTFLSEAAYIVNSTPLWINSSDPNDPQPISPIMLLTLKDSTNDSPGNFDRDAGAYGIRRWRYVQYLSDRFWQNYQKYYLSQLQTRNKWKTAPPCLQKGDVVLLRLKSSRRTSWPIGLIEEAVKSSDGLVRKLLVRTIKLDKSSNAKAMSYERPINEVVLLHRPA